MTLKRLNHTVLKIVVAFLRKVQVFWGGMDAAEVGVGVTYISPNRNAGSCTGTAAPRGWGVNAGPRLTPADMERLDFLDKSTL